jgi:hypothetical protein
MKLLEACDVEFNQTCWWWWCPFWSHLSGGYFPAGCCYLCLKSSNDCSSSSSAPSTKAPDLHVTEGRRSSPQKNLTVLAYHNDAGNKSWDNMMHSWSWLTHLLYIPRFIPSSTPLPIEFLLLFLCFCTDSKLLCCTVIEESLLACVN